MGGMFIISSIASIVIISISIISIVVIILIIFYTTASHSQRLPFFPSFLPQDGRGQEKEVFHAFKIAELLAFMRP
jgi:hypothetical protein